MTIVQPEIRSIGTILFTTNLNGPHLSPNNSMNFVTNRMIRKAMKKIIKLINIFENEICHCLVFNVGTVGTCFIADVSALSSEMIETVDVSAVVFDCPLAGTLNVNSSVQIRLAIRLWVMVCIK